MAMGHVDGEQLSGVGRLGHELDGSFLRPVRFTIRDHATGKTIAELGVPCAAACVKGRFDPDVLSIDGHRSAYIKQDVTKLGKRLSPGWYDVLATMMLQETDMEVGRLESNAVTVRIVRR